MHLSLQWKETALMMAYDSGHIECAKMLVDKGAQVNIQGTVSLIGVIIHCGHAMQHVARVNDDLCGGTLFSGWMPCYLISKISAKMPTSVTIMIEMWNHCVLLHRSIPIAIPDEYI